MTGRRPGRSLRAGAGWATALCLTAAVGQPLASDLAAGRSSREVAEPWVVMACTLPGEGARTFRLEAEGVPESRRWFLALDDVSTNGRLVRVALPDADPRVAADGVALDYRSANGGVIVRLEAGRDGSLLDVYVSYELEVNIDADLDPRVDLLNTHGPRRDVVCRAGGQVPR